MGFQCTYWEPDSHDAKIWQGWDDEVDPPVLEPSCVIYKGVTYASDPGLTDIFTKINSEHRRKNLARAVILANAPEALVMTQYDPMVRDTVRTDFYPQASPTFTISEEGVVTYTLPGLRIEERPPIVSALQEAFGSDVVLGG